MQPLISLRGIVFSAIFAALTSVLSFLSVPLPFSPVPITLGNMGLMLAGAFLGPKYGFFSIFLFWGLTALGLPLLRGTGGLGVLLGPSGGYLIMWPIGALLVGWFVERVRGNGAAAIGQIFALIVLGGVLPVYLGGVPWLAYQANLPLDRALAQGMYPFIPGDLIKALIVALVVVPVRRVYPSWRLVGTGDAKVAMLND